MDASPELNPTKVRAGLAVVSVIFVVAVVLVFVVDDTIGKSIFFAIAGLTLLRAFLLVRWLKRGRVAAA